MHADYTKWQSFECAFAPLSITTSTIMIMLKTKNRCTSILLHTQTNEKNDYYNIVEHWTSLYIVIIDKCNTND